MLVVGHLYPELLNLYGDRGNLIAFVRRCAWRGIPVTVRELVLGAPVDFGALDFLFIGGGSDREQGILIEDLHRHRDSLCEAIEGGLVVLAICGGYQVLGHYYQTPDRVIPGLGLLDFYTQAGPKRLIGNCAVEIELDGRPVSVAGFENHSGQTFLGRVQPLGRVLAGFGNNGVDGTEGARYKNVFCSYLHGPLLPKNPCLTDHLISLALKRAGMEMPLVALDDHLEERAVAAALKRAGVTVSGKT